VEEILQKEDYYQENLHDLKLANNESTKTNYSSIPLLLPG